MQDIKVGTKLQCELPLNPVPGKVLSVLRDRAGQLLGTYVEWMDEAGPFEQFVRWAPMSHLTDKSWANTPMSKLNFVKILE